ncbi:RNA ligase [Mycena vulgaris]|nr:RNA ligase [Mycena vulgaris]
MSMATSTSTPSTAAARPVVPEDSALIEKLHSISAAKPKLIKSSVYAAPADAAIAVRSWKMDEFKYYDIPSPFPTLARGIFTVELPGSKKAYRIVARGRTPRRRTRSRSKATAASSSSPALTPEKLLITSKHSIGPTPGEGMSHAEAGEVWLQKYLAEKGRTEAQFAGVLWENNWTAIAELCDDSFEEHVLAYPADRTGLHLHGLNTSTTAFHTLPQAAVDAFAAEWGFIRTKSVVLNTIAEVRAFTDAVEAKGEWEGEAVEGFVVRTHVSGSLGKAPYADGATLFFKIKFDEPYMMYRDWREVTKALLRQHEAASSSSKTANAKNAKKTVGMSEAALPKNKLRRAETRAYVRWAMREIVRDPEAFAEYNKNKGIVATRERFLAFLKTEEGEKLLAGAKRGSMSGLSGGAGPGTVPAPTGEGKEFGKTIIVPIAVPGCGKTAISIALVHIFGFAHTQSDDVSAKKAAPVFIKNVLGLLGKNDVVIADKNNHLQQHRAALRTATAGRTPPVRLLALNWSLADKTPAEAHAICAERVAARGANHQTLRTDDTDVAPVIWMFVNQTEGLADAEVDGVVEMVLGEGLEEAVRRAAGGVAKALGLPEPAEERVKEGVEKARGYEVKAVEGKEGKGKRKAALPETEAQKKEKEEKRKETEEKKKKAKGPRYYALLPEVELPALLEPRIADEPMYAHLLKEKRVAAKPHVTLVHTKAVVAAEEGAEELWARCAALAAGSPVFRCTLGSVLWDERVMVVTVDDVRLEKEGGGQTGAEFVSGLGAEVRGRLHITVGTRDAEVPAVEGKRLVEAWRAGEREGIREVKLEGASVVAKVQGLFS